jgi:hypothetical protein
MSCKQRPTLQEESIERLSLDEDGSASRFAVFLKCEGAVTFRRQICRLSLVVSLLAIIVMLPSELLEESVMMMMMPTMNRHAVKEVTSVSYLITNNSSYSYWSVNVTRIVLM